MKEAASVARYRVCLPSTLCTGSRDRPLVVRLRPTPAVLQPEQDAPHRGPAEDQAQPEAQPDSERTPETHRTPPHPSCLEKLGRGDAKAPMVPPGGAQSIALSKLCASRCDGAVHARPRPPPIKRHHSGYGLDGSRGGFSKSGARVGA